MALHNISHHTCGDVIFDVNASRLSGTSLINMLSTEQSRSGVFIYELV